MLQTVLQLLSEWNISLCAPLALEHCRIQKPYLLERAGIRSGTAFLFAVPYYTTFCDDPARNISAYAVAGDYHRFFTALFDEILPALQTAFPQNKFAGFSDHSPIDEVDAAARAGLGLLGCHGLLLTEAFSSYVFIGEIITDAIIEAAPKEVLHCTACGACKSACAVGLDKSSCRSALTQKKGLLTEEDQKLLRSHGLAWGCDRCQERCPVTLAAIKNGSIYSNIPYFDQNAIPHLTADRIASMNDEEFSARAYSWRGRETVLRNLKLLEGRDSQ